MLQAIGSFPPLNTNGFISATIISLFSMLNLTIVRIALLQGPSPRINLQVNIISLSRKFCIYLNSHHCLHHGVNMNFASDKASFGLKYKHVTS